MPTTKRLVRVPIAFEFLFQVMTKGFRSNIEIIEGLPEGAKFEHLIFDSAFDPRTAYFVFSHPSFEEVQEMQEIPELQVKAIRRGQ
jgi:hypothetical protein